MKNMQDNPLYSILIFFVGAFFFKMWLDDARRGGNSPRSFPGAGFASYPILIFGPLGALLILAIETVLECRLGFSGEQSEVKFWAVFVWISAAVTEEIIFRGYIVIQGKGRAVLYAGIFAASVLFALCHPFLWDYTAESGFQANLTGKAFFSTAFIFANSLWLYFLRFNCYNKTRSLLPCMVAHAVYNIGVFAVKTFQGFVVWEF